MKNKLWGVLGKQQVYNRPKPLGEKVPLNANPTDAWDYKKSRYKRIDLFPKNAPVSFLQQQAGVPEPSGTAPTPTPTPIPAHHIWDTNNRKWENDNDIWNA
jgi:hypothetical protein